MYIAQHAQYQPIKANEKNNPMKGASVDQTSVMTGRAGGLGSRK